MVMEGGREWKGLADQEVSARIPPQFVPLQRLDTKVQALAHV